MTAEVRPRRQGFRKPQHPEANGTCWECGVALTGRRRHYCSAACMDAYWGKYNWNVLRARVLKRDNYICQRCGCQCSEEPRTTWNSHEPDGPEVDHIIPISKGGLEFDIVNCRTLCHACHNKVRREQFAKPEVAAGISQGRLLFEQATPASLGPVDGASPGVVW